MSRWRDWWDALFERADLRAVCMFHFLAAALIFSPFFLRGQVIVGSSDNEFHLLPNMLFARDAFANGELGHWNPFILTGTNFAASTHHHLYSPLNWPLFLAPERWFFHLLTLRMCVELWLLGVCSYLFFREELKDRRWALVSSTMMQLGGYAFFAITTYANLSILPFVCLVLYVVWSFDRRPRWKSLSALTFAFAVIVLTPNLVYSAAAILTLCLLFLYRAACRGCRWSRPDACVATFALSLVCSLLLCAFRWLPFALELAADDFYAGGRASPFLSGPSVNYGYLWLTHWLPEAWGVNLSHGIETGHRLGLGGAHFQFHSYPYFGIVSALLVLQALRVKRDRTVTFFGATLLIASFWYMKVWPVRDLLDVLSGPMRHEIVPKMLIPFCFCTLAGHVGKRFCQSDQRPAAYPGRWLAVLVAVVTACAFVLWGVRYDALRPLARCLVALTLASSLLAWRRSSRPLLSAGRVSTLALAGAVLVAVLVVVFVGRPSPMFIEIVVWEALSLGSVLLLCARLANPGRKPGKGMQVGVTLLGGLFLAGIVLQLLLRSLDLSSSEHVLTSLVGILRFLTLAAAASLVLNGAWAVQGARRSALVVLLLLADLIPYNKVYGHQSTEPFVTYPIYPSADRCLAAARNRLRRSSLDFHSYRVNAPHRLTGISGSREICSNIPSLYGVRSYGGVNSTLTPRKMELLRHLAPETSMGQGMIAAEATDARYLDLVGCRYDVDALNSPVLRNGALARFMLFRHFELVPDDEACLARLAEPDFRPLASLVLDRDPGLQPGACSPEPASSLAFDQEKTTRLRMGVDAPAPALLFFGDTHDAGWHAYVDGEERPVLRADYLFMAVAVPAGRHEVLWQFRSAPFAMGVKLASAGGILWCIMLGALLRADRRRRSH
ncbi:MAG: hypothetical protein JXR37_31665 [Kiritimatiellae bacterium]|nr:hypothetical protein [Kiritimatiellia bacterium]